MHRGQDISHLPQNRRNHKIQKIYEIFLRPHESQKLNFKDFADRALLERLKRKPSTVRCYLGIIDHTLLPYWGNTKLIEMGKISSMRTFDEYLLDKGLKKSTRNQTFVVSKMYLQLALEDQILSNNPIKDYKLENDVKKIDIPMKVFDLRGHH